MKVISKEGFQAFVDALIEDGSLDVEGVKAKGPKFAFGPLDCAKQLRLDYDTTILPPKKYFLPQYETMMEFDISKPFEVKPIKAMKKKVIIGVHPYDIVAIKQMDQYYMETDPDAVYMARRKNSMWGCSRARPLTVPNSAR